jgi:hypothetical protein
MTVRSFESLCEELRDLARKNGDGRQDISISDRVMYGAGMDALIACRKMLAISDYAKHELGVTLYIHNGEPDFREVPR